MTHQGGPGQGSITYPLELADRPIRDAVREYDIVSFDYRGTGASTPLNCPPTSVPHPSATGTQKVDFDAGFDWTSQANKALVFDRAAARGHRFDIPAGTAVRFEPGLAHRVPLVPLGGSREVHGLSLDPPGRLDG